MQCNMDTSKLEKVINHTAWHFFSDLHADETFDHQVDDFIEKTRNHTCESRCTLHGKVRI